MRFGSRTLPLPPPIVYTTISTSINSAIIRHERDSTSHLHVNSEVPLSLRPKQNSSVEPRGWMSNQRQQGSDQMASGFRLNTTFIFPLKNKNNTSVLFPNSSPRVFKPHIHTKCSSNRTLAPPSLSGSWRRVSLLRILALLHHNTHDVSTFHTHIFHHWATIKTCRTSMQHPPKGPRSSGQLGADPSASPMAPNLQPTRPAKPFTLFPLPADLKNCGKFNFYFAL